MMDGCNQLSVERTRFSPLIGILYAEDFDEVATESAEPEAAPEPVHPPGPALTQADVDQACADAVASARRHWAHDAEQARTQALDRISQSLLDGRAAAEKIAADAAEALAQVVLTMLSAALPHFCDQHGPAEVRALVDRLLPALTSEPHVVVRVHPDLAPDLQREFADRKPETDRLLTVISSAPERGDVRIEWEHGALVRDTQQILQSIEDVLAQLGLQRSTEFAVKRKLAHAD